MKSSSHSSFSHGRPALIAATVAFLLGAATAVAQSTAADQKYPASDKPASDKTHASQANTSATGPQYQSGAAADVDSTTEINAQNKNAGAAMTGRETSGNKLGWMDRRFVNKTADNGHAEVQIAQLAAERASNAEVRTFAQKLVDDHTKVNAELKTIAGKKNVKLDEDNDHDRAYKRLSKKSGMEFDQEFVEHMIDSHESGVKNFEKAAKDAKDADIRSFASKHVDHLREHLRQAESLRATVMPTGRIDSSSGRSSSESTTTPNDSTSTSTSKDQSSSTDSLKTSEASTTTSPNPDTTSSSSDSTSSSTTPKRDGSR